MAVRSSSPALPIGSISECETSNRLCDRLLYAWLTNNANALICREECIWHGTGRLWELA
jgi:hypothetical protein